MTTSLHLQKGHPIFQRAVAAFFEAP